MAGLTLWHAWQDDALQRLNQRRLAYTFQNPAQRVEAVYVPLNDLGARYAEATTAGVGPDIVFGPPEWLARWALEGLVRPLDGVTPDALRAAAPQAAWDAVTFEGAIRAVPLAYSTLALYYDRSQVPSPPATFDEMLQAAGDVGLAFDLSLQWAVGYLRALGGAVMDTAGDPAFESEAARAWLALLARLAADARVVPVRDGEAFASGEVALAVDGPWRLDAYSEALGDRLGVAMLPALDGAAAAPWVRTENAYISAAIGGTRPAQAMDFLAHVAAQATQAAGSPGAVFEAQAAAGVPFPNRPELEAYWAPLDAAIRAVTERGEDPAAALAQAARAVEAQVAEIRANLPVTVFPAFAKAAITRSMAMADEPIFPFALQSDIRFVSQTAHAELGCAWQGIAGEMRSMDGAPLTRIIMVHIRGSGLNTFVVAGTASEYGAGGWEVTVGDAAAADTYHLTLMHTNGELLSETYRVRFPGNCQGNLALVDFKQVKSL